MSTQPAARDVIDTVNEPRQPFGLPLGSVRGFMSLLICGFFWMVLLWPEDVAKPLLGHFFLLALVLMAFASHPSAGGGDGEGSPFLPWILRLLFVGGSVAIVLLVLFTYPDRLKDRLTPDPAEFRDWWGPFLATMSTGFAAGLFLRFALGREHPLFRTLRAWLSVVGLLMLALELALFVVFTTTENKQIEFFRYWQAVELAFVSAYFGTRA